LGRLHRRDSTPVLSTFAALAAADFFAADVDLSNPDRAAVLLRLHNIQALTPGEDGLREGLALIAWVEIHLFMADDWENCNSSCYLASNQSSTLKTLPG
jgi:hypothetical protein